MLKPQASARHGITEWDIRHGSLWTRSGCIEITRQLIRFSCDHGNPGIFWSKGGRKRQQTQLPSPPLPLTHSQPGAGGEFMCSGFQILYYFAIKVRLYRRQFIGKVFGCSVCKWNNWHKICYLKNSEGILKLVSEMDKRNLMNLPQIDKNPVFTSGFTWLNSNANT